MSKEGKWREMGELIDDELFDLMTIAGEPGAVGRGLAARWAGTYDRISLYTTYEVAPEVLLEVTDALRRS
jgi:hypothetical protein